LAPNFEMNSKKFMVIAFLLLQRHQNLHTMEVTSAYNVAFSNMHLELI